jgi:hypothetical protein
MGHVGLEREPRRRSARRGFPDASDGGEAVARSGCGGMSSLSAAVRSAEGIGLGLQLVNNEVFPPSLNADLTNLFLDLKEGATIISLKPFVPDGFRMNESNVGYLVPIIVHCTLADGCWQCDSFAAIVRMSQHTYHKDWVTWKGDSGTYYVQVIDRRRRLEFEVRMNGGRRR